MAFLQRDTASIVVRIAIAALTRDSCSGYIGPNKPLIADMNPLELNLAMGRLTAALDQLSSVVERRLDGDDLTAVQHDSQSTAHDAAMRLAAERDAHAARAEVLEQANLAVEARLDKLGSALRGLATGRDGDPA